MKRIAKITEIDPVMSKCISVNSDTKLFRIGDEIIHIKDNKTNTNNEQEIDKKIQHITESIYGKQRTKDTQTNKKTLTNNVTNTIKKAVKTPYNAIKNTTQTNTPQDIILYDGQQIDLKQVLESDYNPLQGNTPQNVYALRKKGFVTHNSVLQRSIIFACILRPKSWYFAGIDLKKVELTPYVVYSNVVLGVAMTLENAVEVLRFAQQTMMSRYEALTQMGLKNFLDMPGENRALLVMVDEYGEAASPTGSKTDEGKEADNMKGEVQMMVGSIARLGRAAGVHLVVATQRPDAKLLPGETKNICINTPIITSQGYKKMDEIEIGDTIFDQKGIPGKVINMTKTLYDKKCYKIKFSNGEEIIAGDTHKWPIHHPIQRKDNRPRKTHNERYPEHERLAKDFEKLSTTQELLLSTKEIENIVNNGNKIHSLRRQIHNKNIIPEKIIPGQKGQKDKPLYDKYKAMEVMIPYLTKEYTSIKYNEIIMTTQQLYDIYNDTEQIKDRKYSIKVTEPIQFEEKELPIPPYVLGAWLGDGNKYGGRNFYSNDKQIIENIKNQGYTVNKYKRKYSYGILKLTPQLREIGVLKNKHIPEDYLFSSIQQRKDLLAGLLDTDGTIKRKQVQFSNTNENLIDGVLFLARSLGYKATKSYHKPFENPFYKEGKTTTYSKMSKPHWTIKFTPSKEDIIFYLDRKQRQLQQCELPNRETQQYIYIESIEPTESIPTKCIEVDNDSHTYLCGESLIPTHNSNLGVRINCGYTNSTASSMILDNAEGTKVKPNPKGRFYIQIYSQGNHGQAFFAKEDWMDKYLDSHGLNQDGTPKGSNADSIAAGKEAGLELTEAEGSEYARPEDDWDDELEDLIDENEE